MFSSLLVFLSCLFVEVVFAQLFLDFSTVSFKFGFCHSIVNFVNIFFTFHRFIVFTFLLVEVEHELSPYQVPAGSRLARQLSSAQLSSAALA